MNNRDDNHLIALRHVSIDYPKGRAYDFSIRGMREFRKGPARFWKDTQPFDRCDDLLDLMPSIKWGVGSYEVVYPRSLQETSHSRSVPPFPRKPRDRLFMGDRAPFPDILLTSFY